MSPGDTFSGTPAAPTQPGEGGASIGAGQVKVGLVLPLSASGNAGAAGTAMRSAAEMALAEFNVTDLQLLVKDDGGNAPGARQVAQQAIDEGAEIILGPIFAHSVSPVGQLARSRNIPVMAFSTDANVATRGVYLLSFLPESDVDRIVSYAISQGKKSFAAAIPDNAYGSVAEAAFKQSVARRGGRIVALEHYAADRNQMQAAIRTVAQAAARADAIFIPDGSDSAPAVVQALGASGVDLKRVLRELERHRWPPDGAGTRVHLGSRQHPGRSALLGTGAHQLVGLHRHRWPVPLPRRWHQPARACRNEGHARGRAGDQPGSQSVQRLGSRMSARPRPGLLAWA
jgi:hypothetical protein